MPRNRKEKFYLIIRRVTSHGVPDKVLRFDIIKSPKRTHFSTRAVPKLGLRDVLEYSSKVNWKKYSISCLKLKIKALWASL